MFFAAWDLFLLSLSLLWRPVGRTLPQLLYLVGKVHIFLYTKRLQCTSLVPQTTCFQMGTLSTTISTTTRTILFLFKQWWKQVNSNKPNCTLCSYYDRSMLLFSRPIRDRDTSAVRRGVRSDVQLSCTETRFQKCSKSGRNGSKH